MTRRRLIFILGGFAIFMLGMAFASVPLYRIFCQKTGYGGTPQVAVQLPDRILDRKITVRFNANTDPKLPWTFKPLQNSVTVRLGEQGFALYRVKNNSKDYITGMATYNVTPDKAGPYFNKIECFCFIEQRLAPGQEMDMPLLFFVHPDLNDAENLKEVDTITLSYTFFPYKGPLMGSCTLKCTIPKQPQYYLQTHDING
jgi:cytochrome c oxidase assembly protein subunit 11